MSTPLFALLIGVNTYKAPIIPTLKGCRNDVELMASVLRGRFGLDDQHLRTMFDDEATHEGIIQAIRSHLIENARQAKASGQPEPACLLHYSGHGSMAKDTRDAKATGLDETIVPHDSRQSGVFDIKDWELGALIDELAQYTSNITVVLDCCHSGSGTRNEEMVVRQCPVDLRPQPERPLDIKAGTRSASPAAERDPNSHVLIAACSNSQAANEYVDMSTGQKRFYGAMSYCLAEELAQSTQLTYRELYQRVCRRVWQKYPLQSPQCEGDRDRLLFGGVRPPQDLWITVVGTQDGLVKIDAGSAHGLAEGAALDVFSDAVRVRSRDDRPIARLRIVQRDAVWSLCEIVSGNPTPGSRVEATTCGVDLQRTVSLSRASDSLKADLQSQLTQHEFQGLLQVVDAPAADLCVVAGLSGDLVCDSGLRPLESTGTANVDLLVQQLRKWARYQNALRIDNASPQSQLKGQVSVEFKLKNGTSVDHTTHPALESGTVVQVQITNRSTTPLYLSALSFGYDGSISLIWPAMAGEKLPVPPGKSVTTRAFRLSFAAGEPRVEVQEAIKVFATRSATDFDLLTMDGTGHHAGTRSAGAGPLGQLLEQAAQGSGTRILEPVESEPEEDWTTAELCYHLVRPLKELQRPLESGQAVPVPGTGVVVTAPGGFAGTVIGETISAGQRSVDAGMSAMLDATLGDAQLLHSFQIAADDLSRSRLSFQSPLQIDLSAGQRAVGQDSWLVMATEGELLYPVGFSRSSTIDISWLPPSTSGDEEAGTRSVVRSVRLYVYKLLNWEAGDLGVQRVQWVPTEKVATTPREIGERSFRFSTGEVRKRKVVPSDLKPGCQALLLVHGALSDGGAMLSEIGPLLEKSGRVYDQILAFEYETFATPLQLSATQLVQGLTALGFTTGTGSQADVIAEGIGGLVARAAVELLGAQDRITRCLLAGPMNAGTVLAKSRNLATWLGAAATTSLGAAAVAKTLLTPYLIPLCAGLSKVANDAAVLKDLQPQSDFLKTLNGSNPPKQVPYTILAGCAEMPPQLAKLTHRLADSVLTQLFGDEHDLVVSQTSMLSLREGRFPADRLTVHLVSADHFSYWTEPQSADKVINWLKG
jgi:hypothetical protein